MARRVLGPMTPGAARAVVMLFVLVFAIGVANLLFTTGQVDRLGGVVHKQDQQAQAQAATIAQLRTQLLASCAFAADLGGVPLPSSPKPSKLGVSIVVDSRAQWRKLHCPGALPVPPGLVKWAAYYHLPAS